MNEVKPVELIDAPPPTYADDGREPVVASLAGHYAELHGYVVDRPPWRRRNADLLIAFDRTPLRAYCVETRDSLADTSASRWRSVAMLGEPNADGYLWVVVPQAGMAMAEGIMAESGVRAHLVGYEIEGDSVRFVSGPPRGRRGNNPAGGGTK